MIQPITRKTQPLKLEYLTKPVHPSHLTLQSQGILTLAIQSIYVTVFV